MTPGLECVVRLALLRLLALQNFEVLFFHVVVIFFIIGVGSLFSLYFTGPGYMWMGVLAPLLFLPLIYCVWKLLLDNVHSVTWGEGSSAVMSTGGIGTMPMKLHDEELRKAFESNQPSFSRSVIVKRRLK